MTGHGKRRAGARWAQGEDDESAAELDWLSWELWVPSCQNLNHPPLSRWNQLFHWNFLEKYFGSSASKKMTRQMLSLCHHLLTTDGPVMLTGSTTLAGPGLQNIPRYQDEINWEIFGEAQRQSKWYGNCYPCVIIRLVHLDVEDQVEELLRQLSYAIKNQLVASKAPY